ncbi:hypothetical protein FJQ98_04795 [Lysinibacillus agricola]|uniref:Uncharacterized protein n=1 Tax=Lysinibacillus agricola TaxID=2590012 RepID=A0ABX7AWX8_9BACI|nr:MULTISPECIES: hypothetical protein [Lysinibacillus]KOS62511.1 hypothetical protein AN161_13035 [Lysinibacillus sp. FJAT-14222]QQP13383.1 hypothetical protein FJQ98_04795 [Lysinibacillus agricola]
MPKTFLLLISMLLLVVGCQEKQAVKPTPSKKYSQTATTQQGDFLYELSISKPTFTEGESISITAKLTYVGQAQNVTIYHGGSPFLFNLQETTRNFEIPSGMDTPLITRTLERNVPYEEVYTSGGLYDEFSEPKLVEFMKQTMNGHFPKGHYIVNGSTDFYTEDPNEQKTEYKPSATIEFKVQ